LLVLDDLPARVGEQMERLKRLHVAKFEEFRAEAELKVPRRPQFSKELLNQMKIQAGPDR
jgi:hypothetical protein